MTTQLIYLKIRKTLVLTEQISLLSPTNTQPVLLKWPFFSNLAAVVTRRIIKRGDREMGVPSCTGVFPSFECQSDLECFGSFCVEYPTYGGRCLRPIGKSLAAPFGGLFSLIFKFPLNFER
ncbi:Cystathionine gamma-synthase [Bertholletia excelsa]